ncbi:hypothetical protein F7725_021072 [Dissostichus mawsoni]|uniref:Uncharacterized protein n=1 Tax=Dissostichus mawsoni TaxID=36200 RepID=A0A7J5YF15_DISMA|nr:hypothetical protein F7725_021072 [Dissostichus mawsoni]
MLCWKLGEPRSGVALLADVVDAVLMVVVHKLAVPLGQAFGGLVTRKLSDSDRFFTCFCMRISAICRDPTTIFKSWLDSMEAITSFSSSASAKKMILRMALRHLCLTAGPAEELYTSYRTPNRVLIKHFASSGSSFINWARASLGEPPGMPQSAVVPPLPDGALCGLSAALLQHHIHREDALSGQAGHQLTAGRGGR